MYVFTAPHPDRRVELSVLTHHRDGSVPSLALLHFPAGRFERELYEIHGIVARSASPQPGGTGPRSLPGAPAPTAIAQLEAQAQHRPVQALLPRIERIVPDSGFAHALAFCLAVEDAYDVPVPAPVAGLRSALLELERIHNHLHAVGAMCAAGGLTRQAAEARDVRRRILRLNHELSGHRLLRGSVVPGGIRLARVPTPAHIDSLESAATEVTQSIATSPTLRETYQGHWTLTNRHAALTGVLGFVARASGIDTDARREHPFHPAAARVPCVTSHRGDALARLRVRAGEIEASFRLLRELLPSPGLAGIPSSHGPTLLRGADAGRGHRRGLGLVEGPRGTIVHRVVVRAGERVVSLRMVDPSFLNRSVFTLSQRGPHDERGSMVASGFDVPVDRAVGP